MIKKKAKISWEKVLFLGVFFFFVFYFFIPFFLEFFIFTDEKLNQLPEVFKSKTVKNIEKIKVFGVGILFFSFFVALKKFLNNKSISKKEGKFLSFLAKFLSKKF